MTKGIRVLVCGGRTFSDVAKMQTTLGEILQKRGIAAIIHGGVAGAEWLAGRWAANHFIQELVYYPYWGKDGREAGPIRNARMLEGGRPDLVVAFTGGRGTADMVRRARKAGVEVLEVRP